MDLKFPKVVLVILDGFGIASPSIGNAITRANPAFLSELVSHYPMRVLQASGPAVGLPWGEKGNSEVGHITIGAGRVVTQELSRINNAISDGSFFQSPVLQKAIDQAINNKSTLHLIGMIGNGGVHAYEQHLYTLMGTAIDRGVTKIALHIFTDGRDAPQRAALASIEKLERHIKTTGIGNIASVTGRFYAMDRGGHWEQSQATLNAMLGVSEKSFSSASQALANYYQQGLGDEMIPPTIITDANNKPVGTVTPGDAAIFFNYRNDRMIQLLKLFIDQTGNVAVTTMTSYDPSLAAEPIFAPSGIADSLGEVISKAGFSQFRAAETEKFAHVTFFFNGQRHEPWPGEEREIIKSPVSNASNYEDVPAMSAYQLTDAVIKRLQTKDDRFVLVNYANCDMVGHTGSLPATEKAIAAVDECLRKLYDAAKAAKAIMLVTADHGNCEEMLTGGSGEIDKEHSTNPIPFITIAEQLRLATPNGNSIQNLAAIPPEGILADIAPTVLHYLDLPKPEAMTGSPLIS